MKRIIILWMFISIVFTLKGICRNNSDAKCKCSQVMKKISQQWIEDSLAGNGYRITVVKQLLNCRLDSINVERLYEYLGKPTKIKQFADGTTSYRYYFYDYKFIDTSKNKTSGYGYDFINFNTDGGQSIFEVTNGTGEY